MEGKFQLTEVDAALNLSNLLDPADYTAAGSGLLTIQMCIRCPPLAHNLGIKRTMTELSKAH